MLCALSPAPGLGADLLAEGQALVVNGQAERAAELFKRAAEAGDPQGAYGLGVLYSEGSGVPKDPKLSMRWIRTAAEKGFLAAEFNLGNAYLNGVGVGMDVDQAASWWRKAAQHGFAPAQFNLGTLYVREGASRALREEGIAWYRASAAQGFIQGVNKLNELDEPVLLTDARPDPAREPERGEGHLMTMDPSGFTIQLFSASQPGSAERFIQANRLTGAALQFRFLRETAPWTGVVFGWYADREAVRNRLEKLKPELKETGPWMRPVADVQAQILQVRKRDGSDRLPPLEASGE